jgi:cell division protein FtsI/penicillin-binding protein 2
METAAGVALFFAGSFALIAAFLLTPRLEFYTGGVVILLFIIGLFYAWGNAIRQGRKLEQAQAKQPEEQPETQNNAS